jgi:hypothetical protein
VKLSENKLDSILKGRAGIFAIAALFLFRLAFGLCSEFWFEDELQVYLIGLKFYTTGQFPFFGPDVVYTFSQIPGALQGLLVGLPFYLWPVPEAPYILLNILSTAALCFLAYYIGKRIPGLPLWFTWLWVLTCPWVLNYSTHIVNPSYVLPAAIVFFIAFFESIPKLSTGFIKQQYSFLLMGICLLWIFQLHMSWVLLIPFIIYSISVNFNKGFKASLISFAVFLCGCLVGASLLIPTLITYGWKDGLGGTSGNIVLNWANLGQIITVFTRYLSLASFELPRFIGFTNVKRIEFIKEYIWVSPFIIFAGLMGFVQPLWMIIAAFLKNPYPYFKRILLITGSAFIITWLSFLFSVKGPSSHTFYVLFPLIMIYSFYCWKPLLEKKWIKYLAIIFLFSGLVFHITLMRDNYKRKSMYINRQVPLKAIQEKNYHILGERRNFDRNP